MKKEILLIGLMFVCLIFFSGCMKTITTEDFKECNEGKYKANDIFNRMAEEYGAKIYYVEIYKIGNTCYTDLVFTKNLDTLLHSGKRVNVYSFIVR
jgi:uncharacterized protein YceK